MPCLLEVESSSWRLEIVGRLPNVPSFVNYAPSTRINFRGRLSAKTLNPASGQMETADDALSYPIFFENTDYDLYLTAKSSAIDLKLPSPASLNYARDDLRHYRINFRNDVGFFEIEILANEEPAIIQIEVFPLKIDYRSDYLIMRDEISEIVRNLAFSVLVRTYGQAIPSSSDNPTLAEWLALVRFYFNKFMAAAQAIERNPHSRLLRSMERTKVDRVRKVDPALLRQGLRRLPLNIERGSQKSIPLPRQLPDKSSRLSFDTEENRYFKAVLQETRKNLKKIIDSNSTGDEDAELTAEYKFFRAIRPQAIEMLQRVQQILRSPFLKVVSGSGAIAPNSLVMHMHPNYAVFSRFARALNGGLSFATGPLQIGVKNIALLYEYWCFLKLAALLRGPLLLKQHSVVRTKHLGITVVLAKGRESAIEFEDPATGRHITLTYNRRFINLPTLRQIPDNVIRLTGEHDLFIFDAKYRIAFDPAYQEAFEGIGPTAEDIETMHRYRDAIVAKDDGSVDYIRIVSGGIVLFPYPFEDRYMKHRFYRSIESIGIGGLPFLPRCTHLVEEQLRKLLAI
jgi:predicted component of viral defense system (DUF524 family)